MGSWPIYISGQVFHEFMAVSPFHPFYFLELLQIVHSLFFVLEVLWIFHALFLVLWLPRIFHQKQSRCELWSPGYNYYGREISRTLQFRRSITALRLKSPRLCLQWRGPRSVWVRDGRDRSSTYVNLDFTSTLLKTWESNRSNSAAGMRVWLFHCVLHS